MWLLLTILFIVLLWGCKFITPNVRIKVFAAGTILMLFSNTLLVAIDFSVQTTDYEIWSGNITNIEHKEEWDEWHPPTTTTETYTETDSDGNIVTKTRTVQVPGYWEHHYAQNWITTSDKGKMSVSQSPDGKRFSDDWPNTTEELYAYWQLGNPTASIHSYKNLVQASNSLFKHDGIDVKDYPNLPDYPTYENKYFVIDRLIGNVPNKDAANHRLNQWNAELNKRVPDPEREGKTKSYKEVNVIFVNLGDVTIDYAYALQEKWENGNKNDYIISFSMSNDGTIHWVYPFSWTDVELLRLEIRDKMLDLGQSTNFVEVVDDVCSSIENLFVRKQMAEFDYLQINPSTWVYVTNAILNLIIILLCMFVLEDMLSY